MDDYDRGYRPDFRSFAGNRGLEIVTYRPPLPPPPGNGYSSYDRPPVPPRRSSSQGSGSVWVLNDPEMKRRRRVASYKAYCVEGRVKASLREGFRWIKTKCSEIVHGW